MDDRLRNLLDLPRPRYFFAGGRACRTGRRHRAGRSGTRRVSKLVRLDLNNATIDAAGLHGEVIGTDGPFGNLVLNVPAETFRQLGYKLGDAVPVTLDGKKYSFPFVKTFSDVPVGKELFYIDSRGRLSIGINQRNFAETFKVARERRC